jgi:ubiquinone/menaquinone biosynthesis C-methylase UbiE/c-di-GMP-binding flagellar brake protein YcgR/esterase/lipase
MIHPLNRRSRDQRKHVRVDHSGTVQFISEGRLFFGQAVNISRSGMQVVVNLPDSYRSIRTITFTLAYSGQTIELPCRLVRAGTSNQNTDEQVLGIEFSYEAEAQMLLIENYIREMKREQLERLSEEAEMRQFPRTPCAVGCVKTNRDDVTIQSIDNINSDGLLISFLGNLKPYDKLELDFALPGEQKQVSLSGEVVYIIENNFQKISNAGIRILNLKRIDEARIHNFILTYQSSVAFKGLCEHFLNGSWEARFQIKDKNKITAILDFLHLKEMPINLLFSGDLKIYESRIKSICREEGFITLEHADTFDTAALDISDTAYVTFIYKGGSYFFKTDVVVQDAYDPILNLPEVIFHSEKRSYKRKFLEMNSDIRLWTLNENDERLSLRGRLIDISRRGFLCQVIVPFDNRFSLRTGQMVKYELDHNLGLGEQGEIRHLNQIRTENDGIILSVGVEADIQRRNYKYRRLEKTKRKGKKLPSKKPSPVRAGCGESILVSYNNSRGQEIKALINSTRLNTKTPVVVIPPALGKKKEALSPFVATIITNFSHHQKDITVLRFDGINRPGESYNEQQHCKRGYEMLRYRVSQGLDDLSTTIDFVKNNPYFEPAEIILLTFSMSAIDARKLLSSGQDPSGIHLWISCMGVACAQTTIGNILAGIDIIGNYKMGVPNGLHGMLGHMLDMDLVAKDLIEKKYAYMTDARQEMSRIKVPILWIYGEHDRWVPTEEVHDLMSVEARTHREVVALATGHNLRTSEDAIDTFKLITEYIYKNLFGQRIEASDPQQEAMLRLISYERERLEMPEQFPNKEYWRGYLIGDSQKSAGYDFYRNLKEFKDFLNTEIELLNLHNGSQIADMGCGTGLLLETLLEQFTLNGNRNTVLDIEAVDLVPEALDKTRAKCESVLSKSSGATRVHIQYRQADLEPNRLIPVHLIMNNPKLNLDYLRNKISGFRNVVIDELLKYESEELYQILGGESLTPSLNDFLVTIPKREIADTVIEFNRAARFIRRDLRMNDLVDGNGSAKDTPLKPTEYDSLRTSDLRFEILDFGDNGLDLSTGFEDDSFTRIIASLLISYLFNGEYLLSEFYRILKPGGVLLVSSMKPDSDISTIFRNYIRDVDTFAGQCHRNSETQISYCEARSMLNEAAGLFELEEEGFFRFYDADELVDLFAKNGFRNISATWSLGEPPQAVVVTGEKPYR